MTTTYKAMAKTGRVQTGEGGSLIVPRVIRGASEYGIVACHGAGSSWDFWFSSSWLRLNNLLVKAAKAGIPSIAEHLGGETYGNPTSTSRVDAARTALAAGAGCSSAKIHLVGVSMGGGVAPEYAIAHPDRVASMTLMLPLASIINTHKTNPPTGTEANAASNLTQAIATAWGTAYRTVTDAVTNGTTTLTSATANFTSGDNGKLIVSKAANGIAAGTTMTFVNSTTVTLSQAATTSGSGRIIGIAAPLPAGADILANAAVMAGIPTRMYYAPDDTLITPADVTALAAAIGALASATATNGGGHTDTGALPTLFDFDEWIDWLITNGA